MTKDDVITSISPGVFFYFTKVNAPRPSFTVNVVQTCDNPAFPLCPVLQDQVTLDDGNCSRVGSGAETTPGQTSVNVTGAQPGQVYIICIKYSLKSLIGVTLSPTDGAHYDFRTVIDGQTVDQDPDGLQIGVPQTTSGGNPVSEPDQEPDQVPYPTPRPNSALGAGGTEGMLSEADRLELYRPVPNPFRDGMRMAYEVGAAGERVQVSIYDLAGRRVRALASGFETAGRHLVTWDGRDEAGPRARKGVYFVHVQIGGQARQMRVTFLE